MSKKIIVSDFAVKVIKVDEDDAHVSFRATVTNKSKDKTVLLQFQGLDDDGFEVVLVSIYKDISKGDTVTITAKEMIEVDEFSMVVKWQQA